MRPVRTRLLTFSLVCLISAAFTAPALGQGGGKKDPKTEALELFEKSADLYRDGKFDEAAQLLERAYGLHPEPVLLYNLGRAYEGLGENQKAVDAYTKYLEVNPKAKDRGALERRLETLKAQIEKDKQLEAERQREANKPKDVAKPNTDETPAAKPSSGFPGVWPWVVTGVGVATVGAGLFVGIQAKSKRNDAQDNKVSKDAAAEFDSAKSMATTANVLLIAGTIVTAGGVTWALLSRKKTEPAREGAFTLTVTPGGVLVGGHL